MLDPTRAEMDRDQRIVARRAAVERFMASLDSWARVGIGHGEDESRVGRVRAGASIREQATVAFRGGVVDVDDRAGGTRPVTQSPYRFLRHAAGCAGRRPIAANTTMRYSANGSADPRPRSTRWSNARSCAATRRRPGERRLTSHPARPRPPHPMHGSADFVMASRFRARLGTRRPEWRFNRSMIHIFSSRAPTARAERSIDRASARARAVPGCYDSPARRPTPKTSSGRSRQVYGRVADLETIENLRPWLLRVLYREFVGIHAVGRSVRTLGRIKPPDLRPKPPTSRRRARARRRVRTSTSRWGSRRRVTPPHAGQRALVTLHLHRRIYLDQLAGVFDAPVGTLKSRLPSNARRTEELDRDGTFSRRRAV